jgi:hypothetical protein
MTTPQPDHLPVHYAETVDEIDRWCQGRAVPDSVFGLHTVWRGGPFYPVIQLCDGKSVLLARVRDLKTLPRSMANILSNPSVIKAGIGLKGNANRLRELFPDLEIQTLKEIAHEAKSQGFTKTNLNALCLQVLDEKMVQPLDITTSNWKQADCAVFEASKCWSLFNNLKLFYRCSSCHIKVPVVDRSKHDESVIHKLKIQLGTELRMDKSGIVITPEVEIEKMFQYTSPESARSIDVTINNNAKKLRSLLKVRFHPEGSPELQCDFASTAVVIASSTNYNVRLTFKPAHVGMNMFMVVFVFDGFQVSHCSNSFESSNVHCSSKLNQLLHIFVADCTSCHSPRII